MTHDEARAKFASAAVARLATVRPDGRPHIVPVVFACEDDVVYTGVDRKPKRTRQLQRLRNIAAELRVSLLVDHYVDEWPELWWVRADGDACVVESDAERQVAIAMLVSKYERYREEPPDDVIVRIDVTRWRWWSWE